MNLASRIHALRKARNLSQEALGKLVGMTQQTVQAIEEGKTLHPRKIKQLAAALGTTPENLLYGVNHAPDPLAALDQNTYNLFVDAVTKLSVPTLDADLRNTLMGALRMVAKQDVTAYDVKPTEETLK